MLVWNRRDMPTDKATFLRKKFLGVTYHRFDRFDPAGPRGRRGASPAGLKKKEGTGEGIRAEAGCGKVPPQGGAVLGVIITYITI